MGGWEGNRRVSEIVGIDRDLTTVLQRRCEAKQMTELGISQL
jgi:hypothetical protein